MIMHIIQYPQLHFGPVHLSTLCTKLKMSDEFLQETRCMFQIFAASKRKELIPYFLVRTFGLRALEWSRTESGISFMDNKSLKKGGPVAFAILKLSFAIEFKRLKYMADTFPFASRALYCKFQSL